MCTQAAGRVIKSRLVKALKAKKNTFIAYKVVVVGKAKDVVYSYFGGGLDMTAYVRGCSVNAIYIPHGRDTMPFDRGIHVFVYLSDAKRYSLYGRIAKFKVKKGDILHYVKCNSDGEYSRNIPCLLMDRVVYTGEIVR